MVNFLTAYLSTALLISHCSTYFKFVLKVVFEEHVLNEAIYKISWFFTISRFLALRGWQVSIPECEKCNIQLWIYIIFNKLFYLAFVKIIYLLKVHITLSPTVSLYIKVHMKWKIKQQFYLVESTFLNFMDGEVFSVSHLGLKIFMFEYLIRWSHKLLSLTLLIIKAFFCYNLKTLVEKLSNLIPFNVTRYIWILL